MEKELKIKSVEWKVFEEKHNHKFYVEANKKTVAICHYSEKYAHLELREEAESHAKLIAEAGTVYNQSGLTPRELLEQNKKLLSALGRLVKDSMANDFNEHWDSYENAKSIIDNTTN